MLVNIPDIEHMGIGERTWRLKVDSVNLQQRSYRSDGPMAKRFWIFFQWSTEKRVVTNTPGHLLYVGDELLPSYIEITINHDKDPY